MELSIIIPVYNSSEIIPELVSQLKIELLKLGEKFEIILINDGSRDDSWLTIEKMILENHEVIGINLMKNFGQHNALLCGIRSAKYETILTMDDDLQHPPTAIPSLIQKLQEGHDVVYASPQEEQHGLWRDLASKITKIILQEAMGVEIARKAGAFRIFRTQLREAFSQFDSSFVSIDVLLTWATNRFSNIEIQHFPRKQGVSNYTFWKLLSHAVNLITGFSVIPLQIASILGLSGIFFGLAVMVFVLGRYFAFGGSVPGFPFLASIISIFSGIQLFALGVIGEYLARMHFRIMKKPPYAIREIAQNVVDPS
ncbi:MAG: glycosyltransferase family 2 protein [Candidatus Ozemobacteraceae bacterium]